MIRKNGKKIFSSAMFFASLQTLTLQAQGGNVGHFSDASQKLNLLGKQKFLEDMPCKDETSVIPLKILAYFGIGVAVLFVLYWVICIDSNRKLLKNTVNIYLDQAKREVFDKRYFEGRRKDLLKKKDVLAKALSELEGKLTAKQNHLQSLLKNDFGGRDYLSQMKIIKERIEKNIKIGKIVWHEYRFVERKENIKKESENLKEKLKFFEGFGLNFDADQLVLEAVEVNSKEIIPGGFFESFIKTKIKFPIYDSLAGMQDKAKGMLEGLEVKLNEDNSFLAVKNINDPYFVFTFVDAEETFQGKEEQKKEFKEIVKKYNELSKESTEKGENFGSIKDCLDRICDSARDIRDLKKLKEAAENTISVEDFFKGAKDLLDDFNCFLTHVEDEKFKDFRESLRESVGSFKVEEYKIGEFDPKGVLFDYTVLGELKAYVEKKIFDFEKDVKETNEKISELNQQKAKLEEDIGKCEENLKGIKIEDLTPCEKKMNFYKKQKEELEKNWWKPRIYEFEKYKENNTQLPQIGE